MFGTLPEPNFNVSPNPNLGPNHTLIPNLIHTPQQNPNTLIFLVLSTNVDEVVFGKSRARTLIGGRNVFGSSPETPHAGLIARLSTVPATWGESKVWTIKINQE